MLDLIAKNAAAILGRSCLIERDGRWEVQFEPFVGQRRVGRVPTRGWIAVIGHARGISGIVLPDGGGSGGRGQGEIEIAAAMQAAEGEIVELGRVPAATQASHAGSIRIASAPGVNI